MKYTTEYMFLKGALKAAGLYNSLKAMSIMYNLHGDQTRDDGTPYYSHPVRVANYLFTLLNGRLHTRELDICIAAALLHDVLEDCKDGLDFIKDAFDADEIVEVITILSKNKIAIPPNCDPTEIYYQNIEASLFASLVKCSDRCHNVSTMAGVFNKQRLTKYVDETNKYVLPLIKHTRESYPKISDVMVVMSYHIKSVIEAITVMIPLMEE